MEILTPSGIKYDVVESPVQLGMGRTVDLDNLVDDSKGATPIAPASVNDFYKPGVDTATVSAGVVLAGLHIDAGARKFGDFVIAMGDHLGIAAEELRVYFGEWYTSARDKMEHAGHDVSDMDSPDAVETLMKSIFNAPNSGQECKPIHGCTLPQDSVGEAKYSAASHRIGNSAGDGVGATLPDREELSARKSVARHNEPSYADDSQLPYLASQRLRDGQTLVWIFYFLIPILTGILAYHWLPNEHFDPVHHSLVWSDDSCDFTGSCSEIYHEWTDKVTAQIYTPDDFSEHRHAEAFRLATIDLFYMLLGCSILAYLNGRSGNGSFFNILTKATFIAVIIDIFYFTHNYVG